MHYSSCLQGLIANVLMIVSALLLLPVRGLHRLNVEGNQLPGLPCTMLSINPSHILLGNNLMQPVFWKHKTALNPQVCVYVCVCMVHVCTCQNVLCIGEYCVDM